MRRCPISQLPLHSVSAHVVEHHATWTKCFSCNMYQKYFVVTNKSKKETRSSCGEKKKKSFSVSVVQYLLLPAMTVFASLYLCRPTSIFKLH